MYIPKLNSYFIHIPKCGGTSVELFFWEMHGVKLPDKRIHPGPRNCHMMQWGWPVPGIRYETQHMTAWHLKERGIQEFINADYKFAMVRNPWDRFMSECLWKHETFGEHLSKPITNINRMMRNSRPYQPGIRSPHDSPQWKFVLDENDEMMVDDVFKLEEMDKAEKKLSEVFNMPVKFGHHNKAKLKTKEYDDYYTPVLRDRLKPLIQKDLEVFGYE